MKESYYIQEENLLIRVSKEEYIKFKNNATKHTLKTV